MIKRRESNVNLKIYDILLNSFPFGVTGDTWYVVHPNVSSLRKDKFGSAGTVAIMCHQQPIIAKLLKS